MFEVWVTILGSRIIRDTDLVKLGFREFPTYTTKSNLVSLFLIPEMFCLLRVNYKYDEFSKVLHYYHIFWGQTFSCF